MSSKVRLGVLIAGSSLAAAGYGGVLPFLYADVADVRGLGSLAASTCSSGSRSGPSSRHLWPGAGQIVTTPRSYRRGPGSPLVSRSSSSRTTFGCLAAGRGPAVRRGGQHPLAVQPGPGPGLDGGASTPECVPLPVHLGQPGDRRRRCRGRRDRRSGLHLRHPPDLRPGRRGGTGERGHRVGASPAESRVGSEQLTETPPLGTCERCSVPRAYGCWR